MLTTLVPVTLDSPAQVGSGVMRTMVSLLVGSAQMIHGPVQYVVNFLGTPGWEAGVKSHTLAPGRKLFLSWWYCRRWRRTAMERCSRAYFCALSILFLRSSMYS